MHLKKNVTEKMIFAEKILPKTKCCKKNFHADSTNKNKIFQGVLVGFGLA